MKKLLLLSGIFTALIGGIIYVLYREHTLLYQLMPQECMQPLRANAPALPHWVVYNLPGGLWSTAYILIMHCACQFVSPRKRLLYVSVIPLIGVASELLQALHLLPGVFDWPDLIAYALPLAVYKTLPTSLKGRGV